VSLPVVPVDWTVNEEQPLVAETGFADVTVVTGAFVTFVPVPTVSVRVMPRLSVAEVTVLPPLSLRQTLIVDVATPLAGIGFGVTVTAIVAGEPKPVNDAVPVVLVRLNDVATASHVSAFESATVKVTVDVVELVWPAPGLPVALPAEGLTAVTVALHKVVVPVWLSCSAMSWSVKLGLPAASWT